MPIRVLPIHLVNKIAAGEVIERPASVVKELVENAIDAGATRIDVAVEDGGRKLLSVSDDGSGMGADDLGLAFVPHATSKIAAEDDLFNIHTMGFRGEALASIASISHAHIRTRPRSEDGGWEIEASGETVGEVRPCAAAAGTTITIRDLFFNVPARRKFMRTVNTETGHISEQITRLALPHPQVAFTLTSNGRTSLKLPAVKTTLERASDILGAEVAAALIPIVERRGPVAVAGLVSKPSAARATAQWQYFFLNGRFIRDRLLSHAIREAYRGLIDPSRYGMAFVFITIDPADVDVNVHPTKIEVRFRDSQSVHGHLLAALRETLNGANLSPTATFGGSIGPAGDLSPSDATAAKQAEALAERPASEQDQQRRTSIRQALADFFKSAPAPQPHLSFPESTPLRRPTNQASYYPPAPLEAGQDAMPMGAFNPAPPAPSQSPDDHRDEAEQAIAAPTTAHAAAIPHAIQIHNSYIVAASPDGLEIIDQHALHERLIYNDLKRRLTSGPLAGQRLLIPQTLSMSAPAASALSAHADLLAKLGIEVAPFGPTAVAVQLFPTMLAQRGVEAEEFVRELADKLCEDDNATGEQVIENMLQMLACKAAVKAGDPLDAAEMESLLARRTDADKGSSCPHGRPTTLKMTLKDLEKQFKRT